MEHRRSIWLLTFFIGIMLLSVFIPHEYIHEDFTMYDNLAVLNILNNQSYTKRQKLRNFAKLSLANDNPIKIILIKYMDYETNTESEKSAMKEIYELDYVKAISQVNKTDDTNTSAAAATVVNGQTRQQQQQMQILQQQLQDQIQTLQRLQEQIQTRQQQTQPQQTQPQTLQQQQQTQ
jgi:hypothetical protein